MSSVTMKPDHNERNLIPMILLFILPYNEDPKYIPAVSDHVLGRYVLTESLMRACGIKLDPENLSGDLEIGLHGKPSLKNYPDIHMNISHTDGMVICALSDHEIGADAEKIREFKEELIQKILTANEQRTMKHQKFFEVPYRQYFFRYWTAKEARLKLSGEGITRELTSFSISIPGYLKNEQMLTNNEITCSEEGVYINQLMIDSSHIVSVCTDQPDNDLSISWIHPWAMPDHLFTKAD